MFIKEMQWDKLKVVIFGIIFKINVSYIYWITNRWQQKIVRNINILSETISIQITDDLKKCQKLFW